MPCCAVNDKRPESAKQLIRDVFAPALPAPCLDDAQPKHNEN